MRGLVPPASSMPAWAARLVAVRRSGAGDPREPIVDAIAEARRAGTGLVGDVTNTLASYQPLAASPLHAAVLFEQIGFKAADPGKQAAAARAQIERLAANARLRSSVVPHAPYSVSPGLLRAIAALDPPVTSIHLGESAEELEFLNDGTGAWRGVLESLGAWDAGWMPPRCGPVEYIARAGLLNDRLVAVHGLQLTGEELSRLAAADATLVTCPRSNVWTGAGTPPIARFYESGVRVAVGTDSLASVDDLNIFSELAVMRTLAPGVPASRLLESATRAGAQALGFSGELGVIAPGHRAELIAVRLPAGVEDVEEYLVGGIQPASISWLQDD
jgi:cytosine/adenosine deaminase-related metal-dependent hydrolase